MTVKAIRSILKRWEGLIICIFSVVLEKNSIFNEILTPKDDSTCEIREQIFLTLATVGSEYLIGF